MRTVAWAFERPGGGRSFGFTGLHYLASLDQPELRKLLLNAIVWTAGIEVPKEGITSEGNACLCPAVPHLPAPVGEK